MSAANARFWYGLAVPIAAWVVEGMASFVFSDYACEQGKSPVRPVLIVLTVLMLVAAISAGAVAARTWRSLSRASSVGNAEGRGRGEFMALTGIFISVIFSIAIIWSGLAPIILSPCAVTR